MDPFIAEIIMFGGNFAPRGWAFCDGQLLPISSNSALFSLLGTTYGGDGRTTFGLPDLRGRFPVHPGTGPGLPTFRLGERGGTDNVSIGIGELTPHTHSLAGRSASTGDGQTGDPAGAIPAASDEDIYTTDTPDTLMASGGVTTSTGGGAARNIRNPYLGVNFIIALVGTFPSRN